MVRRGRRFLARLEQDGNASRSWDRRIAEDLRYAAHMPDCIFCEIVAGRITAEVVHEGPAAVGDLFLAVKAVQAKVERALRPSGMNVGWNHGRAAGQHVHHLHIHVIPRFEEGVGASR